MDFGVKRSAVKVTGQGSLHPTNSFLDENSFVFIYCIKTSGKPLLILRSKAKVTGEACLLDGNPSQNELI